MPLILGEELLQEQVDQLTFRDNAGGDITIQYFIISEKVLTLKI